MVDHPDVLGVLARARGSHPLLGKRSWTGCQSGMRGGAEQVRPPCRSRVDSPTAAGGQMQVAVHGLGKSMQHDLFGYRRAAPDWG